MPANKTALGYYTFSEEALSNLWGKKYTPIDLTDPYEKNRVNCVMSEQIKGGVDPTHPYYDNPKWENFPINFPIPNHGKSNLTKFVQSVSSELVGDLKKRLVSFYIHPNKCGKKERDFIITTGWVRYPYEGKPEIGVAPQGDVFVLDTETFVRGLPTEHSDPNAAQYKEGIYGFAGPVIATASDNEANYIWMHSQLAEDRLDEPYEVELVPLEDRDSICLMYNSAYDIPRIENIYTMEECPIKFFDLMSMCIARHSYSDDQNKEAKGIRKRVGKGGYMPPWVRQGCPTRLIDDYNHLLGDRYEKLSAGDKTIRNFFLEMSSLRELWGNLENMLKYSLDDSVYTYRLAKAILPSYLGSLGMDTTLYCHQLMAVSRFRVDGETYQEFLKDSENKFHKDLNRQSAIFDDVADKIYEDYLDGYITEEEIKTDPWYRHLDWTSFGKLKTRKTRYYKGLDKDKNEITDQLALPPSTKVGDFLIQVQESNPEVHKLKFQFQDTETYTTEGYGVPSWYYPRMKEGTLGISTKKHISHYLLRLKYLGFPVTHSQENAWTNLLGEKPIHKKGVDKNVGNILSNDQYEYFLKGDITSDGYSQYLEELFNISERTSFWLSTRKRALDQHVHNGVMIGGVIAHQTISTRSASTLWSVVPNPQKNKIGSDFKNLITCEEGRKVVGFDFDG